MLVYHAKCICVRRKCSNCVLDIFNIHSNVAFLPNERHTNSVCPLHICRALHCAMCIQCDRLCQLRFHCVAECLTWIAYRRHRVCFKLWHYLPRDGSMPSPKQHRNTMLAVFVMCTDIVTRARQPHVNCKRKQKSYEIQIQFRCDMRCDALQKFPNDMLVANNVFISPVRCHS